MSTDWVIDSAQGTEVTIGRRVVTSFASANYLSFEPPCTCRSPAFGGRQTLGLPAFLARDADSADLEQALAAWLRQPGALLGKSTFHLLVDLMTIASSQGPVLIHRESYSLTRLAARVLPPAAVRSFASVQDARRFLKGCSMGDAAGRSRRRPTLFVDGWSLRGSLPPLGDVAEVATRAGGRLVVDDTQAIGVLGEPVSESFAKSLPWGKGGSGTPAFLGVTPTSVVTVASLGKAFGIPIAFAAGCDEWIRRLRARGPLLRASSQAPLGLVRAARQALEWNGHAGDAARARLTRAVEQFRSLLTLESKAHSPLQRWVLPTMREAHSRWQELWERGVWCLLERERRFGGALAFLLTAAHEGPAIARTAAKLERIRGERAW